MPGPFYFAWAGGAIQDQLTLVINGATHGAPFETSALVGDVDAISQQLTNLASTASLETGALYRLSGPSIPANTLFLFDDSVLAGLPGSLNLTQNASAAATSATFQATKAVPVGVALGTLTQGSNSVALADLGSLPAGTYGIFGTGIGETDIPQGSSEGTTYVTGGGSMVIGSCFVNYNGAGSGTLFILAASSHRHHGALDQFGQETWVTTYTVTTQPVRATASGAFALQLTGFPAEDAYLVDAIPAGALSSLMPGLLYNIGGPGITVGTTFTAPATSATSITLDLFATASDPAALLTITGPRTPNAAFDPAVHNRFDEDVLSVEISQDEGGIATLTVEVKNPGEGLLKSGRNLWAWLSWDSNWPAGPVDLVPLFNGRLVGVPALQAGEVVQLQFLARPDDLVAQKTQLAESLAVLPYYDPAWSGPVLASPDQVLETYSALWHIDRTTLELTASDILAGEDGTIAIGEDESIYDRFTLSYGQPPLLATTISGTVAWQQQAEGTIDVTQSIVSAFAAAGSKYNYAAARGAYNTGGGGLITCLCGDGLKSDWPKPGTSVGGGWSLSTINDAAGYPLCYCIDATRTQQGGWMAPTFFNITYAGQAPPPAATGDTDSSNVGVYLNPWGNYSVSFPVNVYKVRMNLDFKADRKRTETVTAVVTAGVQFELSDSVESDRETIQLSSEFVAQGVDAGGELPIGDAANRSYFQTPRGAQSFEYLLLAARAKMRARARSVDIAFAVGWRTALGITLRNSIAYTDRRLPGGFATGKVKSLRLTASTAGMHGEFTIGASVGLGGSITAAQGAPVWADPGYVNGYQVFAGAQTELVAGELVYQSLDQFVIEDDGLDLKALTETEAVNECVVNNGLTVQMPYLYGFNNTVAPTLGDPINAMRTLSTTVTLDLKPVQGAEFHTDFFPAVGPLVLPKTIDLSASSGG